MHANIPCYSRTILIQSWVNSTFLLFKLSEHYYEDSMEEHIDSIGNTHAGLHNILTTHIVYLGQKSQRYSRMFIMLFSATCLYLISKWPTSLEFQY